MKRKKITNCLFFILATGFFMTGTGCVSCGNKKPKEELVLKDRVWFKYETLTGIGYEDGVSRRDPSDILKSGDQYYIWYTRIPAKTDDNPTPLYNSGYYGTVWYASSVDGYSWVEQGQALAQGEEGAFDSHAVFTPNILEYQGKYYLYYTAVKPTPGNPDNAFENNSETDITAIGVAVADSPDGPFQRVSDDPILEVSDVSDDFDSYRVDDASLLVKDDKVWLYYKGRSRKHGRSGPGHTQMGVAFADQPEGPYEKYPTPLLERSHEVLIWNQDDGVAALASISQSINWAPEGIEFSRKYENLKQIPRAPGLFRPHLTEHSEKSIPGWGICHDRKEGHIFLRRFTVKSSDHLSQK
jgi:hypothetical protein